MVEPADYDKCFKLPADQQRFETKEDIEKLMKEKNVVFLPEQTEELNFGGNSFGREACEYLQTLAEKCTNLKVAKFDSMFVSRLRSEIPDSISCLVRGIEGKPIVELDMSDNAFGPDGIKAWEFYVKACSDDLKIFKVNNCGISPLGGEMIAAALKANPNLKLEQFEACRDRLENDGFVALASYFKKQKTLKSISMFQNGARKEGIIALFESMTHNPDISEIRINDNWLKEEAVDAVVDALPQLKNLKILDISDCQIGQEGVSKIVFHLPENLEEFYCNFNDADEAESQFAIFEHFLTLKNLKKIDFRGNDVHPSAERAVKAKYEEVGKVIEFKDPMVEDEDADEEDEEEPEDDVKDLVSKINDLKLN